MMTFKQVLGIAVCSGIPLAILVYIGHLLIASFRKYPKPAPSTHHRPSYEEYQLERYSQEIAIELMLSKQLSIRPSFSRIPKRYLHQILSEDDLKRLTG